MHLKTLTIPLLAIAALSSVPASAGFINFDNLAAGVIVTNQYQAQGVVFTPSGSGLSSRITNVQIGEFGTAPFSNSQPNALFVADPGDSVTFHFVTGSGDGYTPFVNFRAGDGDAVNEIFRVQMFDCFGTEIYNNVFTTGSGPGVSISFAGQIHDVRVTGLGTPGLDSSGSLIDDIEFGAIDPCPTPEPGSLLLIATSLIALAGSSRLRSLVA